MVVYVVVWAKQANKIKGIGQVTMTESTKAFRSKEEAMDLIEKETGIRDSGVSTSEGTWSIIEVELP